MNTPTNPQPTKIPANLKILVVDDMTTMRKIIINNITQIGFTNFKEAADGKLALDLMKSLVGTPDEIQFVFTDINMPNMNGIELLKAIKADLRLKKVPVMIISAENEIQYLLDATSNGAADFIVKPIAVDDLAEKIMRVFNPKFKTN